MRSNYKILDIDMDYFLHEVPMYITADSKNRVDGEVYVPWTKESVISFIENNLGLSKQNKINGKIVEHHHEALYCWRDLINQLDIKIPFEVVHVDSHADLGLGFSSWVFILEKILGIDVEKRSDIEHYKDKFDEYKLPNIGDYLLFALSFRWISKLTYVSNPSETGDDYPIYIMKNFDDNSGKIQLPYNNKYPATDIFDGTKKRKEYLKSSILEPEVEFDIVKRPEDVKYKGDFDFITFCISPNYTPESANFIIDIIKEYIK